MNVPVHILYEDRSGPRNRFGLHLLVEACVADLVGKRTPIDGRPLKGNRNVKKSSENPERIGRHGEPVVALYDSDRAYELVGLTRQASREEVQAALRSASHRPDQLRVFLLDENQETVVRAAGDCDHSIDRDQLKRALEKDINARDLVLQKAASSKATRECVKERVPTFGEFIAGVAGLIQQAQGKAGVATDKS
jgi:hypothetical protein